MLQGQALQSIADIGALYTKASVNCVMQGFIATVNSKRHQVQGLDNPGGRRAPLMTQPYRVL